MRKTVTLDSDVYALIKKAMRERGLSFKNAVNFAISIGLTQGTAGQPRFVQRTSALGTEQNFRWDKALAAAGEIEDGEQFLKLRLNGHRALTLHPNKTE